MRLAWIHSSGRGGRLGAQDLRPCRPGRRARYARKGPPFPVPVTRRSTYPRASDHDPGRTMASAQSFLNERLYFVTPVLHDGWMVIDNDTQRSTSGLRELPEDLEAMAPGPRLAALLAAVDRARLSDHDVVRLMVARDRLVSHDQAERAADIVEVTRRCGYDDLTGEFAALEVGRRFAVHPDRRPTRGHVRRRCHRTASPGRRDVGVRRIDMRRARVMADGTAHLDAEAGRRLVTEVADRAPGVDHRPATRLATQALCDRRSRGCQVPPRIRRPGPASRLGGEPGRFGQPALLDLPPDVAAAARERIDFLARSFPVVTGAASTSVAPMSRRPPRRPAGRRSVGAWSTSPLTFTPCWRWPRTRVSWVGGDRWSPTSPARSPTGKPMAGGRPP